MPRHTDLPTISQGGGHITSLVENVIPALTVAKASVTGLGIPGIESVVGGSLKVLDMVKVCSSVSLTAEECLLTVTSRIENER